MPFLKDIVLKGKEFAYVVKKGERLETVLFRCYIVKTKGINSEAKENETTKKLGLIISKKLTGKAVARNRVKRLLREVYRRHYKKVRQGTIVVIKIKKNIRERWKDLKPEDIEFDLKGLWLKIVC
ncbi:MAG: ribonuclease P protein component [bacterium]